MRSKKEKYFKGKTPEMNGHVFEGYGESVEKQQYTKTVNALAELISKTMGYPKDIVSICKRFKLNDVKEPEDLTSEEEKSDTKKLIWKTNVQTYVKRVETQEKNCESIFAIIWGQCSTAVKNKLQSLDDYKTRSDTCDCVWLLEEIK